MPALRKVLLLASVCAFVACDGPVTAPTPESSVAPPTPSAASDGAGAAAQFAGGLTVLASGTDLQSFVDAANARLAALGARFTIHHAEWIDASGNTNAAKIVFANDRTLRLGSRWVPGDPRRGATGADLTEGSFAPYAVANGAIPTEAIVDATFDTWNAVSCSNLRVDKVSIPSGVFPSAILSLPGYTSDPFAADISTIGFLPGWLFDAVLGPGASGSVLGVTFTSVWVDIDGNPTDIDHDHRDDTAFKEVWYNDDFLWTDQGGTVFDPFVDIQTIALHENGHAVELGHFGKLTAHYTKKGLRIQASPRAVMNATYLGTLHRPRGTDIAAMCSDYGSW